MRNILILGSFGFIGTNIIKFIDSHFDDISVIAYDRFPSHIYSVDFRCIRKSYAGDFSDAYLLERVFIENKIDLIIHSLSATVPSSSIDNEFDLKFNVLPTIYLLNMMVKYNVKDIVFMSSGGAIYGEQYHNRNGHAEDEILFPKSAYGISKLTIEKYLYLYAIQNKVKSLIIRLSNPYGPYHYSQKQGVVNIAIERALNGKEFEIWGDGNGKKDYIFIEDFCEILFKLINNWHDLYTVLNVGSGQLLSVNEIVDIIKTDYYPTFKWNYQIANSLDIQDFKLDLSKLNSYIGEFHFTDIYDGLSKTLAWYRNTN